MKRLYFLAVYGLLALGLPIASYGDSATTPTTGEDIAGKPLGTDVQGSPNDKNVEGDRAEDAQGNASHDIYGNATGTEGKK